MINNFNQLEQQFKTLSSKKASLEGKVALLSEQIKSGREIIEKQSSDIALYKKCVEFIQFVSTSNQEIVKKSFENIVSNALNYVFADESYFKLEFGRRGNLADLDFNIVTAEKKEPGNLLDSESGGKVDIVALALRLVLLKITNNPGFIFFDESFSRVRGKQQLINASTFLQFIYEKFNRQIFLCTDQEEFVNNSNYNVIKIGN